MSRNFDHIPMFDADNHVYEPIDALTEFLPDRHKGKIQLVQVGKRTRISLRGHITDYIPNPTFEVISAPGSHAAYYAGNNPDGLTLKEMAGKPIRLMDSMRFPEPRMALLDEQRVAGTVMFPTLANLVEYHVADDPMLTHEVIHSLNQWVAEHWGFVRDERIYFAAAITCALVDRAIAELEWVLDHGAKVILMRPAPCVGYQGSRIFSLPEFDPFWARVQEAGVAVCLHSTEYITARYADWWEPRETENAFDYTAYRHLIQGSRDIEDTIGALVCHGTLNRFPRLRIASVENGASWVGPLQKALAREARLHPKSFAEDPVEMFRRNIWVSPYWEEDMAELVELAGEDHVIYGSDWPHPEGLASPRDFFGYVDDLDDSVVRKVVHDNVRSLLAI